MYLLYRNESIDALIVTGDITTFGIAGGFAQLPALLDNLSTVLPPKDHIVVVPGNHDVAWGTLPSSAERYRAFVDSIRAAGYVTPLLDGVDYIDGRPSGVVKPLILGDDFLITAINSANMCGVVETLEDQAQQELSQLLSNGTIPRALAAEIARMRMLDMARVSQQQLDALASLIASSGAPGKPLVRIAALHHQLAPVRSEEEVKPFEAIVNLGEVRAFLADANFDVVVHGHKHVDRVVTDVFLPFGEGTLPEHRLIVSSCGTVGGMTATNREIAKLVRIKSDLPTLRRVEIYSVPAVSAGASLDGRIHMVFSGPTQRADPGFPVVVISGATVADAHERLLELATERSDASVSDLICTVEDGLTAMHGPGTYPPVPTFEGTVKDWFHNTVNWWQDERVAEGKPFTHGVRLRKWAGGVNQLEAMIQTLNADEGTSRAIAVLINPTTDPIADKAVEFPSFALLHFRIVNDRLHCNAVFRKQEMRYWWAINVAEIAKIQSEALQRLVHEHPRLVAGRIRTFTSEAVFSNFVPKVNVPQIDRLAWSDPAQLWTMAAAMADVQMTGRGPRITQLRSLMEEWRPKTDGPPTDGPAVPMQGLTLLTQALESFAPLYPEGPASKAADVTRQMDEVNTNYRCSPSERHSDAYQQWRSRQLQLLDRFAELTTAPVSATEPSA
jgi:3',5'-cyclic AMP phosphodiesterase CpdA